MRYKIPESTLVLVYTPDLDVLLIERADHPEHWQSVTGSKDTLDEPLARTARRELMEETGIDADLYGGVVDWHVRNDFEIYKTWSGRYPPGTTHNTEHVFGLMVPHRVPVKLAPREHLRAVWLPWREAAAKVFSWTNRAAIEALPGHATINPGNCA
ncbi:MAG: dihydroneopterin triphosphate diphosphatase [Burkholderiales bacterium]|nr:dihydroneopterin triphosphate diphosphatase [Burkholderiales bacterium]